MPEFFSELFKVRKTVNIHIHAQWNSFFNFAESNAITGIEDIRRFKASPDGKVYFIHRTAIYIAAQRKDVFEYIILVNALLA